MMLLRSLFLALIVIAFASANPAPSYSLQKNNGGKKSDDSKKGGNKKPENEDEDEDEDEDENESCEKAKVKSFLAAAHPYPRKKVDDFCKTFLRRKSSGKKTVTTTVTIDEEKTITLFKTKFYHSTVTTSTTSTTSVTRTIGVYPDLKKREAANGSPPAPTDPIKPDANGGVFGYSAKKASKACSCIVDSTSDVPTKTVTKYETRRVYVTEYRYKTATTTASLSIDHLELDANLMQSTSTDISYSTVSKVKTKTYDNPTYCGTPSKPTFIVQLRDSDPENGDAFNNNWLALTSSGNWVPDLKDHAAVTPSSSKKRAALLYLEPRTGYLRSADGGWSMNSDYYGDPRFVAFDRKKDIEDRDWLYHVCKIVESGGEKELVCYLSGAFWDETVYQTCQEYQDQYERPLVVGDALQTDVVCSRKRFIVVDPCA
ncbi:hypothetical protein ACJ41O_010237 [Fusarium nematophilum]